jgi:hypothetical protein
MMFGAAPSAVRMCMEKPPCMKLSEGRWVIFPSVLIPLPDIFLAVAQSPKPRSSGGRSPADRLAHCPQRSQRPRVDTERH